MDKAMCEHCKKEHFTICLNGALWLCWDCYVLVLREENESREGESNA